MSYSVIRLFFFVGLVGCGRLVVLLSFAVLFFHSWLLLMARRM